ncbi:MAG: metallophosphoesterase [Bacteroidales bacterium]|nr:metallophosphoesterase [Bacteroidales bacterium]MCF8326970.1 metallophosphoesterase [Bacteroidales bacterium]
MKKYLYIVYFLILLIVVYVVGALMENILDNTQKNLPEIPAVHSHIVNDNNKNLYFETSGGDKWSLNYQKPEYTLEQFRYAAEGYEKGIRFDFGTDFDGLLYYGFSNRSREVSSFPVFYKESAEITDGRAKIDIVENLSGKYDMVNWEENGSGELFYRVLNESGEMIYDGKLFFLGKRPFRIGASVIEGPFVNKVQPGEVVISFRTNKNVSARLVVDDRILNSQSKQKQHEIRVDGLQPDSSYKYHVLCDEFKISSTFRTAPQPGSRNAFVFGFTSDSRAGKGGGERNIHGVNAYMMKRISAFAAYQNVAFWQFTGDLIDGYLQNKKQTDLQYANWKQAVEPFAHNIPVYTTMGNHEAVTMNFTEKEGDYGAAVDRFPYQKESAEAVYAEHFVNFQNGPDSEDGASYDPVTDKDKTNDFPSYSENVYSYTWDNVGMIVMNSNYWYAPVTDFIPQISGNPHGYIMDIQLKWLEKVLLKMEENPDIDHVFVTLHATPFPNGGHAKDGMWYHGDNSVRPYINGKAHEKGIIERRDEFLDLMINKSDKTLAVLCGDEHNYNRLLINDTMPRYPGGYDKPKLKLERNFLQLTNGSAGAPYYAQEKLPWSENVKTFSTQNAFILFHVNGKKVRAEVINPETFQQIETFKLR